MAILGGAPLSTLPVAAQGGVSLPPGTKAPPPVSSSNQFFAAKIALRVSASFLGSTGQAFAPSVRVTLKPAAVASTNQVFAPSVRRTVTPSLVTGGQVFSLSVKRGVTAAFVSSSAAVFAPSVVTSGALAAPFLGSTNAFYGATVSTLTISAPAAAGAIGGPGWLSATKRPKAPPLWPRLPTPVSEAPPWRLVVVTQEIAAKRKLALGALEGERRRAKVAAKRKRKRDAEAALGQVVDNLIVRLVVDELTPKR